MSYEVHNMHWYKDKPIPVGSWYVGRPKAGDDWPILANPFVPIGHKTRFEIITPDDRGRYWNRYRQPPSPSRAFVYASLDPRADYRRWLWYQLNHLPSVVNGLIHDMATMESGILLCWCAPAPCHADVIASAIAWYRDQWDRLEAEDR